MIYSPLIYVVGPSEGEFYKITSEVPLDGLFKRRLVGGEEDLGSIYDALRSDLLIQWNELYDLVNPYGDGRGENWFGAHFILNFQDGTVHEHHGHDRWDSGPLSLLCRQSYTSEDLMPCENPIPLRPRLDPENPNTFPPPHGSRPELDVCPRRATLVYSILTDFSKQWRHILRRTYNTATFRRLATAIVRIVTLDFWVRQTRSKARRILQYVHDHVSVTDLPGWEPFESLMVRVGKRAWFALDEDLARGLEKVKEHATTRRDEGLDADDDAAETRYWILSVTHIVLCRVVGADRELHWTKPERLFEGENGPSDAALDILLSATTSNGEYPATRIHQLPVELQDRILKYAGHGPVEAARQGCVLGLGSEFSWLDGKMVIELEIRPRARLKNSPVQSSVYFGESPSGVAYTAIWSTRSSLEQAWEGSSNVSD